MTRRDYKGELGILLAQPGKNLEQGGLFSPVRAPCGNDLSAGRNCDETGLSPLNFLVKLEIARHHDFSRISADVLDPLGIFLGLHAKERHLVEHHSEKLFEFLIVLVGMRRYPSVDHGRGNALPFELPEEVRPKFRFSNQHDLGIDALDDPADNAGVIERKIEDRIRFRHPAACRKMTGDRDRGENELSMGILFFELPDERMGRHHFTDGHGMHPDGSRTLDHPHHTLAQTAELLGQTAPVLGHGDQFKEHHRRQENGSDDKKYIVDDIHESTSRVRFEIIVRPGHEPIECRF